MNLRDRVLGCLIGGLLGDAMGAATEGLHFRFIEEELGEVTDLIELQGRPRGAGTDDSALKHMLCEAIIQCEGNVSAASWAKVWRKRMNPRDFYIPVANSFFNVIVGGIRARDAGQGNMISNSSAMCISPIGIVNAGDPRRAMLEAYEVTSLLHRGAAQDGALAMASATAAAFGPDAGPDSVVEAAIQNMDPESDMPAAISIAVALARDSRSYKDFRAAYYDGHLRSWPQTPGEGRSTAVDPRESVSVALALLMLADGDPNDLALMAANFGRDSDTIGTMGCAIAGALVGSSAIHPRWAAAVRAASPVDQDNLADSLLTVLKARLEADRDRAERLRS